MKDHYLLGDKKKYCTLKSSGCLVKVGGGYETLKIYLEKYEKTAKT